MGWLDLAGRSIGFLLFSSGLLLVGFCECRPEQGTGSSFVVSTFSFPDKRLGLFDWSYARVELPPWFSSMTMTFISNVDPDGSRVNKLPKNVMPIMCFRHGGPPLPDLSDTSLENLPLILAFNGSLGRVKNSLQSVDWCLPFQRNITVTLTNEQISPGVWYVGYFNGLGPSRTQSKMITRGHTYTFSTTLSIEGCSMSTMWGPHCNQTISQLSCKMSDSQKLVPNGKSLLCNGSSEAACLGYGDMKFYSMDVEGPTPGFEIVAEKVKSVGIIPLNGSVDSGRILILASVRHNAMPNVASFDFSADISDAPLVVQLPNVGRWYIGVRVVNRTYLNGEIHESYINATLCFSVLWKVHACPFGMAGPSCAWLLQSLKISYFPSQFSYLPIILPSNSRKFDLEPLLSNHTDGISWTYLHFEIPHGAAGSNLHVQLTSDSKIDYEIYVKSGGLSSVDNWDHYASTTGTGNGSMMLMQKNNEERIDFYILYVKEGPWGIGIKANFNSSQQKIHSMMLVALESCPGSCSSHGSCRSSVDQTGLSFYSFCECDRDHGGFDCSKELVSHHGHIWQSICLIASNAAALFPALSALRQKAFAEWVIFTASGVSSALYHACDVGTWCALSFRVLQFMDFWLSFLAVVSTFLFMGSLQEASKTTIHTCLSIATALLASAGPTRPINVIIVLTVGAVGLLLGWMLKLPYRKITLPCTQCAENSQQGYRLTSLLWVLKRRFRWRFLLMGFITLTAAGVSWRMETNKSYWLWHSAWHITIYMSSFFFLCSVRGVSRAGCELPPVESSRHQAIEE